MDDKSKAAYFEKVQSNIAEYGYHLTYVGASKTDGNYEPSFCYSTGMAHTHGIPEIFISSLPSGLCADLIKGYVERFKTTKDVIINEKFELLDDWFSVYLCDVENHLLEDYALSTFSLFNSKDFHFLQLVFPDTDGIYPNDIDYDYDQVLLTDYFYK